MENTNLYKILLKSGKGSYPKDILELEFARNGQTYTLDELLELAFKHADQITELKREIAANEAKHARVESLLLATVEKLSAKVGRLEKKMEE